MVSNNTPSHDNQQSMVSLKDSAKYIVGAIVLALLGYFGWSYYQNNVTTVDTVAADSYMDIQERINEIEFAAQNPTLDEDSKLVLEAQRAEVDGRIDALVTQHGDSIYAWQALMRKARQLVDKGEYSQAVEVYDKAMDIDLNDAGLIAITHLRYASALLGNKEVDKALLAASIEVPMSFEATKQELLGDIYSEQNDTQKAQRAYENAWNILRKRQEERAILKLKMEKLGLTPEPIETKPALISNATADSAQSRMALQQQASAMVNDAPNAEANITEEAAIISDTLDNQLTDSEASNSEGKAVVSESTVSGGTVSKENETTEDGTKQNSEMAQQNTQEGSE